GQLVLRRGPRRRPGPRAPPRVYRARTKRLAGEAVIVEDRDAPLQVGRAAQAEQRADRRQRDLDLALARMPPNRRPFGDQKARTPRLAVGRILDVNVGAAAQRPRVIGRAVAVVAEHRTWMAKPAPGDLGLAIGGRGAVELGARSGVGEQDLLKGAGLL